MGFSTDLVQGKVLIDQIDRKILPADKFSFEKGDEIVSMNGKPISEELNELQQYIGQGFELSARRRAAMQIPKRRASRIPPAFGTATLEIRRGDSSVLETVKLNWQSKGKFTDEVIAPTKVSNMGLAAVPSNRVNYDQIMLEESFRCSGTTRIKIPTNATMIFTDPVTAYYWPTEKGNIGYLRIPHYVPEDPNPKIDAYEKWFRKYEYAVKVLEKNTVGLIIDQDHNCGGSVDWLHRMLGLFIEKPIAPMQFELLASKASYVDFKTWSKDLWSETVGFEKNAKVLDLIKDTWLNTNDFLTKKTSLDGEELIYPNTIRYTKPIIVLIDEMSGSGGDAFPALMQGAGRAKLLGTRTVGAGGHVVELPGLNNSQIKVRITKSLFYRPDEVAVENNGAHPDIPYTPTLNDFKYGYLEYQAFFTKELLKML